MVGPDQFPHSPVADAVLSAEFTVLAVDSSAPELTLKEPMVLSFGTFPSRPSGWLQASCLVDGQAVTGYGEGATLPQPVFTDDFGGNIAANMHELTQAAGQESTVGEALQTVQDYQFPDGGHYPTARLATEMALLDAATKAKGTSVRELIGIPAEITEVPYGKSIGGANKAAILRQAEEALENQAKKIKLKVSPSIFPEVMGAIDVLSEWQPGVELMVDANGGFDPGDKEHLRMLSQLDERGLIMIEEPVSRVGKARDLDAVRVLRAALPNLATPICLDDSLKTLADCQSVLDEGLAEIINIKPGRIGSFLQSLELADIAAQQGAEVMVGGMLEGTPGRCMTTLLGAYCLSRGFKVPGDLSLAQERLVSDLVPADRQLALSSTGNIIVPTGHGWGF